jgi:hypothetical protein
VQRFRLYTFHVKIKPLTTVSELPSLYSCPLSAESVGEGATGSTGAVWVAITCSAGPSPRAGAVCRRLGAAHFRPAPLPAETKCSSTMVVAACDACSNAAAQIYHRVTGKAPPDRGSAVQEIAMPVSVRTCRSIMNRTQARPFPLAGCTRFSCSNPGVGLTRQSWADTRHPRVPIELLPWEADVSIERTFRARTQAMANTKKSLAPATTILVKNSTG